MKPKSISPKGRMKSYIVKGTTGKSGKGPGSLGAKKIRQYSKKK